MHTATGFSRLRKNYYGIQETPWPTGHGQQMNIPQDAQKGQTVRPQRVKDGGVPSGVRGGSERYENDAGGLFQHLARITVAIGVLAIFLAAISPAGSWAAEPVKQENKAKKPAQVRTRVPAPKAAAPKFSTAETAGKAPSCFGEAPTLDKLTPDEGKAGDKVNITGTNFGEATCLRGVSFGPGHPAKFQQANGSITTTVPSGGKKGLVLLTVTTASGENSKPFLVK